jgi:hypothetical protein
MYQHFGEPNTEVHMKLQSVHTAGGSPDRRWPFDRGGGGWSNRELLHTGLVTGGATDGSPWVHHWLCLPHLVTLDMMPVTLQSGQNRLRDGGTGVQFKTKGKNLQRKVRACANGKW